MRFKKFLAAAVFSLGLLILPASQALAFNFFSTPTCNYKNGSGKTSSICQQAASQGTTNPVVNIIQIAVDILAVLAGMLAVLMILISGFQLITSGGSTEGTANARKRMVSSIVGLIIIGLAWTIIRLITDQILS
ncbi:MAG TPA: pilin [Candidatus Saccharimonadales bacterium]|nr:pilin [Candidatus Saccharimonadales bacterium]